MYLCKDDTARLLRAPSKKRDFRYRDRSSSEYAVAAAALDAQQFSLVTPCDSSSLQRPLLIEDQHMPPATQCPKKKRIYFSL